MQRTKYRVIELNLAGEPLVYEFSSKPTYTNTVHGFDAAFDARDSRTFKKSVNLSDENFQKISDVMRYYLNKHPMRYRDFETRVLSNFISTKQYVYETIEELDKFLSNWSFLDNQDSVEDVKNVKVKKPRI